MDLVCVKMVLPDAASLPCGTIWCHNGQLYASSVNGKWLKTNEDTIATMSIDVDFSCIEYAEPSVPRPPSPFQRRGRGRPKTKTSNSRQPSAYNLYIQQQMLSGAFAHLEGHERFSQIAKTYRGASNLDAI